jgi:hypothetical protein
MLLGLIQNQPFLMSTIRTALEDPERAHISTESDGLPQSHPCRSQETTTKKMEMGKKSRKCKNSKDVPC